MKSVFMMMMAVVVALTTVSYGANIVTFSDDFESYAEGTLSPSPSWTGYNMGASAQAVHEVDVDSLGVAHSGSKVYHSYRDAISLNVGGSCAITSLVNLRYSDDPGVYMITGWAYLGNLNTQGSAIQMSSNLAFWGRDAANEIGTGVGFKLDGHYNNPRSITYYNGAAYEIVGAVIPTEAWIKVVQTIDEVNQSWSFVVSNADDSVILARDNLAFRSTGSFNGQFEKVSVYFATNNKNDAWNNRVDDITVEYVPEPATLGLLSLGGLVWLRRRG